MALTAQEKALLNIYIDEQHPNTAQREAFAASDALVQTTLAAWKPGAIAARQAMIQQINAAAKPINAELAILNKPDA